MFRRKKEAYTIKQFKSIHIDTEKGIYEINGEPSGFVTKLKLEWDQEDGWALVISKEETYLAPIQKTKEKLNCIKTQVQTVTHTIK